MTAKYPSLRGKIVLVTGASSGIGAATALHFAAQGCRLSLLGRNLSALEETRDRCVEQGSELARVLILQCDLQSEGECRQAVSKTVEAFGGLDVLINNAGILSRANFQKVTTQEIDECMQVNLKSAVILSQESLPHLVAREGSIVNVSSIAGLRAYPGALAYKMSKAAMDQMTRCVALEVACNGVRVNSVNPGVIVTDIFSRSGMTDEETAAYIEQSRSLHPLGRPGSAEEVAATILFLASSEASFITGQTLAVDGGRSVEMPHASYN